MPNFDKKEKAKMMLSRETDEGLHISGTIVLSKKIYLFIEIFLYTVNSFCELAPKLLREKDVGYVLSESFSQDPLEAYFSRQRHGGGGCDNPGVQQFYYNTASLVQRREVYRDLKTMNIQSTSNISPERDLQLPKKNSCVTEYVTRVV